MKPGSPEPRLQAAAVERLEKVRRAMEGYFGADRRRIDHALRVAGHAKSLLREVAADPEVTLAAAYLHDIGIPEAERRYGSCGGKLQEELGPPVARRLLEALDYPEEVVSRVCLLVGRHHTPRGVAAPEFEILWDADALVNLAELVPGLDRPRIASLLERSLVTEPGRRIGADLFLSSAP